MLEQVIDITGTHIMSKIGNYILDQLEKHNIEEINELLERKENERV